ncbi:MAG: hypothetical protein V3S17_08785 [candidate division Zixibacteria bacterium]
MNNINETASMPSSVSATISNGRVRDINQVLEQESDPAEIFFEITNHLKDKYEIGKSVLILKQEDSSLSAISTWANGQKRDGLSLSLPPAKSLFEKVIEDGNLYTESFSDSFSGNFFEQKLLLEPLTQSFALKPLKFEGEVIGLVGFSSQNPTAFAMLEEGDSDALLDRFASKLVKKKRTA